MLEVDHYVTIIEQFQNIKTISRQQPLFFQSR